MLTGVVSRLVDRFDVNVCTVLYCTVRIVPLYVDVLVLLLSETKIGEDESSQVKSTTNETRLCDVMRCGVCVVLVLKLISNGFVFVIIFLNCNCDI